MSDQIIYTYTDEQKNPLFKKVRMTDPKKLYFTREENGKTIYNLDGCRKVLYRLDQVLWGLENNRVIYLVEGEKDVATMQSMGFIATTAHTTTYWSDEFTQILSNADVVILYDYDDAGIKRRDGLIAHLTGKVQALRVIDLPGLEPNSHHDITDWIEQGHTLEELQTLVQNANDIKALTPIALPSPIMSTEIITSNQLTTIGLKAFVTMGIVEREIFLDPIIPEQGLAMLVAKRGVGKTHVALGIAFAIATGGTFLKWKAPKPRSVLYIDGEMAQKSMQDRLKQLICMSDNEYDGDLDLFQLLTPDHQPSGIPDLSTKLGRNAIDHFVQKAEFIVLDNISCLFRSGGENDAEEWQEAQEWALYLRRIGKSILFVHHMGKNGSQRGTSKREDILDTVISLKHPDDYSPEDGAYFEVHFDKARHFSGQDAEPFCIKLVTDEFKKTAWQFVQTKEDLLIEEVTELRSKGLTLKKIAAETELTKSQVETLLIKSKNKGLL